MGNCCNSMTIHVGNLSDCEYCDCQDVKGEIQKAKPEPMVETNLGSKANHKSSVLENTKKSKIRKESRRKIGKEIPNANPDIKPPEQNSDKNASSLPTRFYSCLERFD